MEGIIAENTIFKISEHVEQINQIEKVQEFKDIINMMFDNEESLIHYTENATMVSGQIIVDAIKKNPQEGVQAIHKAITSAVLVGFLSERYTRDIAMPISDNLEFKRDYESIEMFLKKKGKVKGLKAIATEE